MRSAWLVGFRNDVFNKPYWQYIYGLAYSTMLNGP